VENTQQHLRHRKKKGKRVELNDDDIVTALVPDVKPIESSSSDPNSTDSDDDKKKDNTSDKSLNV
jgi:hypothetical protein